MQRSTDIPYTEWMDRILALWRGYLTSIRGYVELAEQTPDRHRMQELFRLLHARIWDIEQMLDNLEIHLSILRSHITFDIRPVDIGAVVEDVIRRFRMLPSPTARTIAYTPLLEPATWIGDEKKLRIIVQNLLNNAIRLTPANEPVGVRMAYHAPGTLHTGRVPERLRVQGVFLLTIEDRGPGIPEELQEQVFAPYFQIPDREYTPHQGLGIGLTVARTLTEALGGVIWLERRTGGGSVFYVALPEKSKYGE